MHADVVVADMEGFRMVSVRGGTASFQKSDFRDNRITSDALASDNGVAVIEAGMHHMWLITLPSEVRSPCYCTICWAVCPRKLLR